MQVITFDARLGTDVMNMLGAVYESIWFLDLYGIDTSIVISKQNNLRSRTSGTLQQNLH